MATIWDKIFALWPERIASIYNAPRLNWVMTPLQIQVNRPHVLRLYRRLHRAVSWRSPSKVLRNNRRKQLSLMFREGSFISSYPEFKFRMTQAVYSLERLQRQYDTISLFEYYQIPRGATSEEEFMTPNKFATTAIYGYPAGYTEYIHEQTHKESLPIWKRYKRYHYIYLFQTFWESYFHPHPLFRLDSFHDYTPSPDGTYLFESNPYTTTEIGTWKSRTSQTDLEEQLLISQQNKKQMPESEHI